MNTNTGYMNLNKIHSGLQDGLSLELYIIQIYTFSWFPQIQCLFLPFFTRLFRQYPVLPALSILVPKDIRIQQNSYIMPKLSVQAVNFKAEVKAEFKLHSWGSNLPSRHWNFTARSNICHIIVTPKGVLQRQWLLHLACLPLIPSLRSLAEASGWTGWARHQQLVT